MVMVGELQAVIMAGGKGSRMTDLTAAGRAKCLLPVGNLPLLWFPLKMLQDCGFQQVIVTVPDNVKAEVGKIGERHNLTIKMDIVGVPVQEEWGTADTLRHIHEKLVGSDILIVSGDLISKENLRKVTDLHRSKMSALTVLLNHPSFDLKTLQVPGSKSTKYKKERDLIGLAGERLCLFKAEADVEEEFHISSRVLRENPRMTIHTNLQDAHLYVIKKWVCDYVNNEKSITTLKGELIPRLVKLQYRSRKGTAPQVGEEGGTVAPANPIPSSFSCHAAVTQETVLRVNNVPSYWEANRLALETAILKDTNRCHVHESAKVGEKAQIKDSNIGARCSVPDKTTISNVALGANTTLQEKVRISNSVIMEGVTIASGVVLQDSIVCDDARLEEGSEIKSCIVGRGLVVGAKTAHQNQILLDTDRMMEV